MHFGRARAHSCHRIVGALIALLALRPAGSALPTRPNIVYVLADDVGWGDYTPWARTSKVHAPTIEGLARDGTVFTRAYAPASVCAPSRYALLTGNDCHRAQEPFGQWNFPSTAPQVMPGQRTLGALLQSAGYTTAFVGKWHLGGGYGKRAHPARAPHGPLESGFNRSLWLPLGIQRAPLAFLHDDVNRAQMRVVGKRPAWLPVPERLPCEAYARADWAAAALPRLAWVREVGPCLASVAAGMLRSMPEPFFLKYSSQAAHAPFQPPATVP
ncbi:alkaline-phosphatase-like protein [Pavlovales sp. CCMP2436]|nr:alkaline-phosphatase-like protein [Pavlovales sp. CCMP2436]